MKYLRTLKDCLVNNMEYRLGDLYEVSNGLSKSGDCFGTGYPFLTFSTVFNNYFIPDEISNLVQSTVKEQNSFSIKTGDVFITRTSETIEELGMSCVALKDYPKATYNGFCKRLRPITENTYPLYMGYYFRTAQFRANFLKVASLITRASLRNEDLLKFKVDLPDIETQKKIASVLSNYDNLIENNNKRIAMLEQMAENLYKEWFVRRKNENWELIKLSQFGYSLESGSRPKGGIDSSLQEGYPSLGAEVIGDLGKFDYSATKLIPEDFYRKMKRGIGRDKDILLYKDGAYIGKVTLFMDEFPYKDYAINEHVFLMRSNDPLYQYYLYFTLALPQYFTQMQNLNRNAAQPGLTGKDIDILKLYRPDEDTIRKFNSAIEPMLHNIFSLAKKNQNLIKQRDLLLPRLMSGKLEV